MSRCWVANCSKSDNRDSLFATSPSDLLYTDFACFNSARHSCSFTAWSLSVISFILVLSCCCSTLAWCNAPDIVSDIIFNFSISLLKRSISLAPLIPPPNETDIFLFEPPIIAPPASVTSPRRVTNLTPPM